MVKVRLISNGIHVMFLADRTNGRAIVTVLRLSSVCNVKYYG